MLAFYDDGKAKRQIGIISAALQLTAAELGRVFGGVSRQAVEQWGTRGVPLERSAEVDRVAEIVTELGRRFKPQRLPVIARGKMPILNDRSIIEVLSTQGTAPIHEFFRRWDSYVPDVEPIRENDFPSR